MVSGKGVKDVMPTIEGSGSGFGLRDLAFRRRAQNMGLWGLGFR